ncbi:MAG: glucose 1-dehydrogenase [Deltaproteobacteria bacterium]|nr:glucose 1-dehydrogenase [Deltaproteobacteria bacterium]
MKGKGKKMKLNGKVALITGGGTGIGAAITKRFIEDGAKVCISGRRKEKLETMANSLPEGSVTICVGDVTREEDVKKMIETTISFGGKIDVLVNNAAKDATGSITETSLSEWRKVLEANLTGPFATMKEAIPQMINNGGGSIINIASLGGLRCMPRSVSYCSSKAGLIMLTQQVALEYGPQNIRSNVVCPGATRTSMIEETVGLLAKDMGTDIDAVFRRFSSHVPLRRISNPSEMGGVCSFLASDDSSFMTGAVLVVDGGAAIVDISGASIS